MRENSAAADTKPCMKECCSNGRECRTDGVNQIERFILGTTKTRQNFLNFFFLSRPGFLLKIDTFFVRAWHKKNRFLFEATVKASGRRRNKMDCITKKHSIFNSIRSPSQSWQCCAFCHFTWLITCGGCSSNTGDRTAGSRGSTLEMTEKSHNTLTAEDRRQEREVGAALKQCQTTTATKSNVGWVTYGFRGQILCTKDGI